MKNTQNDFDMLQLQELGGDPTNSILIDYSSDDWDEYGDDDYGDVDNGLNMDYFLYGDDRGI